MNNDVAQFLQPKTLGLFGASVQSQNGYRPQSSSGRHNASHGLLRNKAEPSPRNDQKVVVLRPRSSYLGKPVDKMTQDILEQSNKSLFKSIYNEDFRRPSDQQAMRQSNSKGFDMAPTISQSQVSIKGAHGGRPGSAMTKSVRQIKGNPYGYMQKQGPNVTGISTKRGDERQGRDNMSVDHQYAQQSDRYDVRRDEDQRDYSVPEQQYYQGQGPAASQNFHPQQYQQQQQNYMLHSQSQQQFEQYHPEPSQQKTVTFQEPFHKQESYQQNGEYVVDGIKDTLKEMKQGRPGTAFYPGNSQKEQMNQGSANFFRSNQLARDESAQMRSSSMSNRPRTGDPRALMKDIKTMRPVGDVEDIDLLENGNKEVFDRDMCSYLTGTCICGKCKWPYQIPKNRPPQNNKSIYQKDFVKLPFDPNQLRIPMETYSTKFEGTSTLDCMSTMKGDYLGKHGETAKTAKPDLTTTYKIPFGGLSAYKSEYIDFVGLGTRSEIPKQAFTHVIPELPLFDQTTYKTSYPKKNADTRKGTAVPNAGVPLGNGLPFLGESHYTNSFKPFKVNPHKEQLNQRATEKTPSWPDQYRSEMKHHYLGEGNAPCPAREVLEDLAKSSIRAHEVLETITNPSKNK